MKDYNYKWARELLYSKDKYLRNFLDDMLNKCFVMFKWRGLPKEIPQRVIERYLMTAGECVFTKLENRFVVLIGSSGGELNEYCEPTKFIVANPYLKLNKEYAIGDDCVLIRNDALSKGLLPILSRYGVLCGDCEISLNMLTNILRTHYVFSASDDKTKDSAELYLKRLFDGEYGIISENAFLNGVKIQGGVERGNAIQQFIELNQYLRATAFNEIGLDANYNMKRERLTENEVDLNAAILVPLCENMLNERKAAAESINEKYGLNIEVDLASVWKMKKETLDKTISIENTETESDKEKETV